MDVRMPRSAQTRAEDPPPTAPAATTVVVRRVPQTRQVELSSPVSADNLESIVERLKNDAWRLAFAMLGTGSEAGDLVQDAFVRLCASVGNYREQGQLLAYLRKIVSRLCLDYRKRRPQISTNLESQPSGAKRISQQVQIRQRDQAIRAALDRLPDSQKQAICLCYYQDMGHAEIAACLGVTPKAAELLLARGRKSLKQHLADFL